MDLLRAVALIAVCTTLVSGNEHHWVTQASATIRGWELSVEVATVHGVVVEGWTRATLHRPDSPPLIRVHGPPHTDSKWPSVDQRGAPDRWDSVSAYLAFGGHDTWLPKLGTLPSRYLMIDDTVKLTIVHHVRIGNSVPPTDEREIFVDAQTGEVLLDRSVLRHVDAGGVIKGRLPEDNLPYSIGATFVDYPLSGLSVFSPIAGETLTNVAGEFTFDLAPGGSTFFTAALDGPLITVLDQSGPSAAYLGVVSTSSPPVEVIFNEIASELGTAEVAGFSIVTRSYDWLFDLSPDFDPIQAPVTVNVNFTGSCFAFYSPIFSSLNFAQSSVACANTAYGTVIAHEYFHHLQNQLVAVSPPYAEAMADTFAAFLLDSPLIGQDFNGPGTVLRDLSEPHQYPAASADPAEEGLPLAAAFWSLRENLETTLGATDGRRLTAELWLASQLLSGGVVDSTIVDDLIMIDDDDGDLSDGTPHATEIIAAFAAHGFDVPLFPVSDLDCVVMENQVTLSWALPPSVPYDQIMVVRNGVPRAAIAGDDTSYLDLYPPAGSVLYTVIGSAAEVSSPPTLCIAEVAPYTHFVRGDANRNGGLELADAIEFLSILFDPEITGYGCDDSLDADDNGSIEITDAIVILDYLFLLGPSLPAPFPSTGFDPTPDALTCE